MGGLCLQLPGPSSPLLLFPRFLWWRVGPEARQVGRPVALQHLLLRHVHAAGDDQAVQGRPKVYALQLCHGGGHDELVVRLWEVWVGRGGGVGMRSRLVNSLIPAKRLA